ncbi:splicing regulatory glutamine/lysine-rich protein 1 isoform X2 [Syngnathoides biaculeatus]|uniref:splicing regulatory glutamine/lysine-rich protein 1 isoform X2 n=1 Tax=Syngnathoides biaculeatus TaxID=300417 RepID=UPI002ADD68B0|nr:splicing regulatory glutamine/lysine-rich protein 1 isoform X2 [Syngnathoides biaculeatus]
MTGGGGPRGVSDHVTRSPPRWTPCLFSPLFILSPPMLSNLCCLYLRKSDRERASERERKIPEESKALSLLAPTTPVHSLLPGGGLLPIPTPAPLQNLNLPLVGHMTPAAAALDPTSSSLSQPPLMGNVDPTKVDEIRRTVYVGNLNSQTTTAEQLLDFFRQVGDVKFVRMAGDETQPTRFAFVEFVEQDAVARALTFNGVMFGDRPLKVNHSNNAIVKPPEMTPQAAAKQLESVMKRVREAQSTIAAAIEPAEKEKRYAVHSGRTRRQSRSRSRSGSRRRRSRSKHRPPQKWSRNDTRTSRGGHGRRSRSRDRRRSTSRSRVRRRSRGRSRSPPRKARSPSLKRMKKHRERSREARERSSSKKRSRKDEERPKGKKTAKVGRDYDRDSSPSEDARSPHFTQHNGAHKARSDDTFA